MTGIIHKVVHGQTGVFIGYSWWCPGCKTHHWVPTDGSRGWTFKGTMEKPSLHPSVRHFYPAQMSDDGKTVEVPEKTYCHYYITDGEIRYRPDCTHELSGKTVPMVPHRDMETP